MKPILLVILGLLFWHPRAAWAGGEGTDLTGSLPITNTMDILGLRPMGMGGAGLALADGPEALYINPAGLRRRKESYVIEGLFMLHPAADQRAFGASISDSKSNPLIAGGLAYTFLQTPRDDDGSQRILEAHIARLGVAYGWNDILFIGVTGKYVALNRPFWTPSQHFTLDVGVTWQISPLFSVAAVGYNLIYNETREMPISMGLGIAIGHRTPFQAAIDWIIDFQTKGQIGHELRAGLQYTFAEILTIRGGYHLDQVRDFPDRGATDALLRHYLTLGVGARYSQIGAEFAFRQRLALDRASQDRQIAFSLDILF